MGEFRMPSLGADMEEGTILEWLVKPGDSVRRGDIVAIVDTDKSDVEVEVFEEGVVQELLVPLGVTVPVGTALALIGVGLGGAPLRATPLPQTAPLATREPALSPVVRPPHGNAAVPVAAVSEPLPVREPTSERAVSPPGPGTTQTADPSTTPIVVSPLVRRVAAERGLDLHTVHGSGPGGAIRRIDIEPPADTGRPPDITRTAETTRPAGAGQPRIEVARPGAAAQRTAGPTRQKVSPRARQLAAGLGLDPSAIVGSGPDGSVVAADVIAAGEGTRPAEPSVAQRAAPTAPSVKESADRSDRTDRRQDMRRRTALLMARSKREIPHFYVSTDIDMSAAIAWLRAANESRPVGARILPAAMLLRAVVLAVGDVKEVNGHWVDDDVAISTSVHLGVAISLRGGGLIAPAIVDADRLGIDETMEALLGLVRRARSGRMRSSDLIEPTITVTNLGDQGAGSVLGVIYPPQIALVGFGRIMERPWAENGMLAVRPVVTATLAADHRAADGQTGSRFLAAIADHLSRPERSGPPSGAPLNTGAAT